MKILHLNTSDSIGGAAIAARRLHMGLRAAGIDSWMLVQNKSSDLSSVIGPSSLADKVLSTLRYPVTRRLLRLKTGVETGNFSPEWFPANMLKKIDAIGPDVVHLHYICRGFGRPEMVKKVMCPIVWTFHDMWPFTGGCHVDGGCGRYKESCGKCPVLHSSKENDLSKILLRRKQKAWSGKDVTVVTLSEWMKRCVKQSSIFREFKTHLVPNGLDLDVFRPVDSAIARSILRLPADKMLILFGAGTASSKGNKGYGLLNPVLAGMKKMRKNVEAVVFGSSEPLDPPDFGIPTKYIGRLYDTSSLVLLYSAVDVFIAPSRQDNLPNTVMEALACGTPCLAFNIGGMPDLIDHQENGYLAAPFDTTDMAAGLNWILEDPDRRRQLAENARKKVERCYSRHLQVKRMIDIYDSVV